MKLRPQSRAELVLDAGLVLALLSIFLPWYQYSIQADSYDFFPLGSATGLLFLLVLLVGIVFQGVRLFAPLDKQPVLPLTDANLFMGMAGVELVLAVLYVALNPSGQPNVTAGQYVGPAWTWFIALIAVLTVAAGGFMRRSEAQPRTGALNITIPAKSAPEPDENSQTPWVPPPSLRTGDAPSVAPPQGAWQQAPPGTPSRTTSAPPGRSRSGTAGGAAGSAAERLPSCRRTAQPAAASARIQRQAAAARAATPGSASGIRHATVGTTPVVAAPSRLCPAARTDAGAGTCTATGPNLPDPAASDAAAAAGVQCPAADAAAGSRRTAIRIADAAAAAHGAASATTAAGVRSADDRSGITAAVQHATGRAGCTADSGAAAPVRTTQSARAAGGAARRTAATRNSDPTAATAVATTAGPAGGQPLRLAAPHGTRRHAPAAAVATRVAEAPGSRDLSALLSQLAPDLHPGRFAFATVADGAATPAGAVLTFAETKGTTVVVPESVAAAQSLATVFPCRWITLRVHSSLEAVGMMAAVSAELAAAGIACNVVSGYHHDHLFVPADRADEVVRLLGRLAGHG